MASVPEIRPSVLPAAFTISLAILWGSTFCSGVVGAYCSPAAAAAVLLEVAEEEEGAAGEDNGVEVVLTRPLSRMRRRPLPLTTPLSPLEEKVRAVVVARRDADGALDERERSWWRSCREIVDAA